MGLIEEGSIEKMLVMLQDFISENPGTEVISHDNPGRFKIGFEAYVTDNVWDKYIVVQTDLRNIKLYKGSCVFNTQTDRLKIAKRLESGEKLV